MTASLTLEDLRRWEDHGATWRAVEVDDRYVVVQLCTCFGEPVELGRSDVPEVVDYVRTRRTSEAPPG